MKKKLQIEIQKIHYKNTKKNEYKTKSHKDEKQSKKKKSQEKEQEKIDKHVKVYRDGKKRWKGVKLQISTERKINKYKKAKESNKERQKSRKKKRKKAHPRPLKPDCLHTPTPWTMSLHDTTHRKLQRSSRHSRVIKSTPGRRSLSVSR